MVERLGLALNGASGSKVVICSQRAEGIAIGIGIALAAA